MYNFNSEHIIGTGKKCNKQVEIFQVFLHMWWKIRVKGSL